MKSLSHPLTRGRLTHWADLLVQPMTQLAGCLSVLPSRPGKLFALSSQTHLAEVAGLSQVVEGLSQLAETKDPIHHGTHRVKFNRLVCKCEPKLRAGS
jgi:hypothetical protein